MGVLQKCIEIESGIAMLHEIMKQDDRKIATTCGVYCKMCGRAVIMGEIAYDFNIFAMISLFLLLNAHPSHECRSNIFAH